MKYVGQFSTTADLYVRFRPHYPPELIDHVAARFALTKASRVLDIGCGPCTLAIPFAQRVGQVIGIDPEAEMLDQARRQVAAAGAANIELIQGSSYDLPALAPRIGRIDLATMGRSFHWMDREATLAALNPLLNTGGGIAVIDTDSSGKEPWSKAVEAVVKKYADPALRVHSRHHRDLPETHQATIGRWAARMEEASFSIDLTRPVESIIGETLSKSSSSPRVLGANRQACEAELRRELAAMAPSGELSFPRAFRVILAWPK